MDVAEEFEEELVTADGTDWGNWIVVIIYECACCQNREYRYDAE